MLTSFADIRRYFSADSRPVYFISACNFNLMSLHEWVGGWRNINLIDCYDSSHPRVTIIPHDGQSALDSIESINAHMLDRSRDWLAPAGGARAVFLFFDERIEQQCRELGLAIALPQQRLVKEIDSKIVTTELADQAGVASVPNLLTKVTSFADLRRAAATADLGDRWVVQTAYGDSGKTTFFIDDEADYKMVASKIEAEERVKIMRRINCRGAAIEACATRWGTFVGPLLGELVGDAALTPYPGGWCGNELYAEQFAASIRRQAQEKTVALGNALYQRGYRGMFEVDYLIDLDHGHLYLGEINPRITGISAMTNLSDFSISRVPLFSFHLLEYDPDAQLGLSPTEYNRAVLIEGAQGRAAQVILKYTEHTTKVTTQAPVSGVYRLMDNGRLSFVRASHNRRDALGADEAYVLRIMNKGEYAYRGADLAIMFVNQIVGKAQGKLSPAGAVWVDALKHEYGFRHLDAMERSRLAHIHTPAGLKGGSQ
jgi:hypothetical protein